MTAPGQQLQAAIGWGAPNGAHANDNLPIKRRAANDNRTAAKRRNVGVVPLVVVPCRESVTRGAKDWMPASAGTPLRSVYATNPLNETRFWEYDASARLVRETVPVAVAHASVVYGTTNLTAATIKSYNYIAACSGVTAPTNTNMPISVTDSEGYVKCYQYDALDRIVKVKYHDGTTDQYDYTFPAGLASQPTWTTGAVPTAGTPSLDVWKITDRLGRITNYVYDRNRRQIAASETVTVAGVPVTRTTQYAYHANGVLKELTDANGNVTRWDIDIQSRPTAKTYAYGTANAKTESYTYDLAGRLKTKTDARGQTVTLTLNKDDSIASYAYTNAVVATPGASFVYDPWYPRRTSMTDQFGTTSWTYKAVGSNGALLPLTENGPFANDSLTQDYDAAGRLSSRTVSNTTAETFGYDLLGRVSTHASQLGSFAYTYLGQTGQVANRTVGPITSSWGYDTNENDRRLLTISTTGAAARNFTYTSNTYQITGITDTAPGTHPWLSQTWTFTHDASDRLLTGNGTIAGNHSYSLDRLDNATSFAGVTGTYNNLNQISTFGAATYTYDANGNLSSDGTRTYTFDAADRLKTITQGATTVTFAYDGLGRRLKQTVGATETRYLWCGAAICQQRSGADTVQKRFYSEGEYVLSGTKKYLALTDHLGSVRDVIDITGTPTLVAAFDYKPYGAIARSWGTVTTGYTYAGLFAQTNTSLLLSTTRAYNPANGKWLNVDPIREKGGINLTGYVGGSPMMGTDPLGLVVQFEGSPGTVERLKEMYIQIGGTVRGRYLINIIERSPDLFVIGYLPGEDGNTLFNSNFEGEPATIISINPDRFPVLPVSMCGSMPTPPVIVMAHEIGHAAEGNPFGPNDPPIELRRKYEISNIIRNENAIRRELGYPERLPVY